MSENMEKAINELRKLEGLPPSAFRDKGRRIKGYNYILEFQDGTRATTARFLRLKYDRNQKFVDAETGKRVKVIKRDAVFLRKGK